MQARAKTKASCTARCLCAIQDKAVPAFLSFCILVAVPAVWGWYGQWYVVVSCKIYNIGSTDYFEHYFSSAWGSGQLGLLTAVRNIPLNWSFVWCIWYLVLLLLWTLRILCVRYYLQVRASPIRHNDAHYHVILTSTNALLYTIYVFYEGHCGIAGVSPRASQ